MTVQRKQQMLEKLIVCLPVNQLQFLLVLVAVDMPVTVDMTVCVQMQTRNTVQIYTEFLRRCAFSSLLELWCVS